MGNFIHLFVLSCIIASSIQYELGQNYAFDYESTLLMDEQHYKQVITSQVSLTSIWKDEKDPEHFLLRVELKDPKLHVTKKSDTHPNPHSSELDSLPQQPCFVELKSGAIIDYWSSEESVSVANLKRSIASLVQFKVDSGDRTEHDASGVCKTSYTRNGWQVTKNKKSCYSDNFAEFYRSHTNELMGVDVRTNRHMKIELRKDLAMFQSLNAEETVEISLKVPSHAKSLIQTSQKLSVKSESDGSQYVIAGSSIDSVIDNLRSGGLSKLQKQKISLELETIPSKETLVEIVHSLQKVNEKASPVSVQKTNVLLRLVLKLRTTNKEELDKIIKNKKYKKILADINDAVAIVNSPPLVGAVIANLNFKSDELDLKERFLIALSTIPKPASKTVVFIQKLATRDYPDEKLKHTLLLTLATMTKKLATYASTEEDKKIVSEVRDVFLAKLKSCDFEESCLTALRYLKNLALPETVEILLPYLKRGGKVAAEVLSVLQEVPRKYIDDKVKREIESVYHQLKKSQDSTARSIAVDLLLETNPSQEILERLMGSLKYESGEVQTYLLTKLHAVASGDERIRLDLLSILKDPTIGNYYTLIPNGKSAFLESPLFQTEDVNSSYSFVMENGGGGILKRSVLDLSLQKEADFLNLLRFQIFTSGLGALAGTEPEGDSDEDEPATGGLKLSVMGSHLRPYTLFSGQGELMGLVWSGAGSEPTNIVQGNFVLQDHYELVPLQNGFVARVGATGIVSYDMSGTVTHSLWNRNADINIVSSAAVVVKGSIDLQSTVVTSSNEFSLAADAKLKSNTAVEFAEAPFKMCTMMSQTPVSLRYTSRTTQKIPQHKYSLQHSKRRLTTLQGKTLALHSKLSQMCSQIDR